MAHNSAATRALRAPVLQSAACSSRLSIAPSLFPSHPTSDPSRLIAHIHTTSEYAEPYRPLAAARRIGYSEQNGGTIGNRCKKERRA